VGTAPPSFASLTSLPDSPSAIRASHGAIGVRSTTVAEGEGPRHEVAGGGAHKGRTASSPRGQVVEWVDSGSFPLVRPRRALAAPTASPSTPASPGAPVALLDNTTRIAATSVSFEELVGLPADEIIGQPFAELCARPGSAGAVDKILRDAIAGAISSAQLPIRCPATPRDRLLNVDFRSLHLGRSQGTMLTVQGWSPDDALDTPSLGDMTYSISLRRFGMLRWVKLTGESEPRADPAGRRCFEVLFERATPCDACPLRQTAHRAGCTGVVRGGPSSGRRPYVVVARRTDSVTALVSAIGIDGPLLERILSIQTQRRADEAGLTTREREVLDLVLHGRSTSEIAMVLRIATSTAKFHQANTLRKLEADSRADLYRRLF
jgi:DNA-binding CsgD family transcriptional regulator